jgi:pimeloyl-ACP methyl ester carboxylesterase
VTRRRGILLAIAAVLAAVLALNTIALDNETGRATVNAEGGEILELTGGDVQVVDEGPERPRRAGAPIVLLHCYTCSLRWWDRVAPLLAREHRVVRIDLLGHGGSEKPRRGYSMPEQASVVAEALGRLEIEDAIVVGHSMGGAVATALAERNPELVTRLVIVDTAPDKRFGGLDLIARLGYVPVIGGATWRLAPDFVIRQGTKQAFAHGFDTAEGFEDPNQPVGDVRAMTYPAYDRAISRLDEFRDETPLNERIAATNVPLLVIFGAKEQIVDDPRAALAAYATGSGVRTVLVEEAGHSPNVETPEKTAEAILGEPIP